MTERMDLELLSGIALSRSRLASGDQQDQLPKLTQQCCALLKTSIISAGKIIKHYLRIWRVDLAMLLFARSTRFISPTKTPEYLR